MTTDYSSVAKQVGTTPSAVERRTQQVLDENQQSWQASGMDSGMMQNRAVRIAARQLITEKRKIASSGCVELSGCFVSAPPYKDWAKMAYNKMNKTLSSLDDAGVTALITNGDIVVYEPTGDGYNRRANPSLMNRTTFEQGIEETQVSMLPKNTVEHADLGIHYYCVADKNMPKYPSGDDNYRYGRPRPASEPERACLFLGSLDGSDVELYEIKFSGDEALTQPPTYAPGTIPVKPGKANPKTGNGRVWTRKGVSVFTQNPDAASILPNAPFTLDNGTPSGIMVDLVGEDNLLASFDNLLPYYEQYRDEDGWWDRLAVVAGEVSHIDTLDNGASTIVVGDLEDFAAPAIEVRVPKGHDIDFSVGSQIALIGQVWKTNDGEARFTTCGWYCYESIAPAVVDEEVSGWDA